MLISERIFNILNEKHMSQNEFAKRVGLAASTVSDWKSKKTNPTAEKIMPICEVLGVTPEQLLTGKDIDKDVEESVSTKDSFVITSADIHLLEEYHGLQDAQRKRLLKYMEALKQIEELEKLE